MVLTYTLRQVNKTELKNMSERLFRLILGLVLMSILYCEWVFPSYQLTIAFLSPEPIGLWRFIEYFFIALMMFEAVTNWRLTIIITRLRYGSSSQNHLDDGNLSARYQFEAERILRLVVVLFIACGIVFDELWWLSWFVGFMLMLAGITSICPMVMFFRWLGFR